MVYYQMQAHDADHSNADHSNANHSNAGHSTAGHSTAGHSNADHSTNTEMGVMNNFEGAQNVNTGDNNGRLIWTISCLKFSPTFS
jgi:hypothetical protein